MFKKITSIILVFCLALGLFGFFWQPKHAEPRDCVPIVFVHGLGGWGEGALINRIVPHWGMLAGSVQRDLNRLGYQARAASVGPVSSAWDRACELFAQLTGTQVDYGEAHSKAHGHARFGHTYNKPLVEGWSADNPIALLGHSFGGPTIRLLVQLLEEGCPVEMAAGQDNISPLFTGEFAGHVLAVITLAGTLNGSTAAEPHIATEGGMGADLPGQMIQIARMGTVLPIIDWFYPFRLGHWGISSRDFYRNPVRTWRAADTLLESRDSAAHDLTIDGAAQLNKTIRCHPGVYYFSFAAQVTQPDAAGNHVPGDFVWDMFRGSSIAMGKRRAPFTTPGGITIDDSWLPNDGLVNVVSQRHPLGEPHKAFDPDDIEPGIWQLMPLITNFDHVDFAGGMQTLGGPDGFKEFYRDIAALIESIS